MFQCALFKRVVRRLGTRRTYSHVGCPALASGALLLPLSAALARGGGGGGLGAEWLRWPGLCVALALCGVGFMTLIPCNNALTNDAADPAALGLANGVAASWGGLTRAAGDGWAQSSARLPVLSHSACHNRSCIAFGPHAEQPLSTSSCVIIVCHRCRGPTTFSQQSRVVSHSVFCPLEA